ncbi:hypothetical protein GCM10027589_07780 [Actinocorallia lasiicapitis]
MSTVDLSSVVWRKSSYSGPTGEECVEVAGLPAVIAVRDSKNPDQAALIFGRGTFASLVRSL